MIENITNTNDIMKKILDGKFNGRIINFNEKSFNVDVDILKNASKFSSSLDKEDNCEDRWRYCCKKLTNDKMIDSDFFRIWIRNMYLNEFDLSMFKNKSLVDIVDFRRMLVGIGYNDIAKYNFNQVIEDQLNNLKPINGLSNLAFWEKKFIIVTKK